VDHPHIIKVWDTFADDSNIYMVMEYAEMGNLFYFQNTKNIFNEAEAFKFFCQTLSAVHYLHINDIIHRDLKVIIFLFLALKPSSRSVLQHQSL
jgi:serine/threonine protein kinase